MSDSSSSNVKIGAILSYALILLNSIYGLVITPYIIGMIGVVEFGVYKTISSLSASLMVLDLGIGGTVTRYIAKYRADGENDRILPFVSMMLAEGGCLIAFVSFISVLALHFLPHIYKNGIELNNLKLARILFVIMAINMCLHILENVLNGIISGHNRFIIGNGLKLFRIIFRILLTYLLLYLYKSSIMLATLDLGLTIAIIILEYIYVVNTLKLKIRLRLSSWDKDIFYESFKYTGLLFLTTIAAQVNTNLDNVVIGAQIGAASVAVYSMGLTIFAMFENLSTAISGVMLPTITNVLSSDKSGKSAVELVIKAGRIQFMLLGAVFSGFMVLGREFISLWLGDKFSDVYIIVLLLMGPSILELCVNVCLSILRAKNILGFRTFVLTGTTIVNAIITVIGVKLYGYYAAAIGTGVSFLLGSVIIMNVYYYKKLNINMIAVYKGIFARTWIVILVTSFVTFLLSNKVNGTWFSFFINCLVYVIIYVVLMYLYGFNINEKEQIIFKMRGEL